MVVAVGRGREIKSSRTSCFDLLCLSADQTDINTLFLFVLCTYYVGFFLIINLDDVNITE